MRPYFFTANGVDLKTLGFVTRESPAPWDSGLATLQEQAIFQRDGAVLTDDEPINAARDVVISGTVRGADADDFESKHLGIKRFFGPRGTRDHLLVFGNQTAQQLTARFIGTSGGPTSPQMLASKVPLDLHFRALDPFATDTTDTTLTAAAATPVAIPLGTARCTGVTTITFSSSAASVTRTYKSYSGTIVSALTLTHAFVNTDVLVINDTQRIITLNGVGAADLVTSGFFTRFSPNDGDPLLSHWPTIETNHGALSLVYRRRWE